MKGISRFPAPLASALLVVWCASCASVPTVTIGKTNRAQEVAAKENEGDLTGAMEAYRDYLFGLPDDADHVPAYLKLSRCAMKLGDYRQAREYFKLAENATDSASVRFEAAKGIGDAYYREARFVLASIHYRDAERYEKNPLILDEIYYKLAVCNQKTENEDAAKGYFAKVSKYQPPPGEPTYAPWTEMASEEGGTSDVASSGSGLRIIDRASWHPRPMRRNYDPMGQIWRLTIHHSAVRDTDRDFDSCARSIKSIQTTHMGSPKYWADIGYHFLVDRAGRIWEGRPLYIQGAHAGNPEANRGNVGICLLGDFSDQDLTAEQKSTLRELVVSLMVSNSITIDHVYTHQEIRRQYDIGATDCPGSRLQGYVDSLRLELRRGSSQPQPLAGGVATVHLVHQGETLFQISRQYGISVADLKQANLLSADGDIAVGQRLRIPR
ncbi:MAG: N-acetylmuramoyl-L-alanine amidase [Planctomycetes bacterium]|nr:N-acetylmuramoyl-L-alanine amidase [Planctomycetota bacterium]